VELEEENLPNLEGTFAGSGEEKAARDYVLVHMDFMTILQNYFQIGEIWGDPETDNIISYVHDFKPSRLVSLLEMVFHCSGGSLHKIDLDFW